MPIKIDLRFGDCIDLMSDIKNESIDLIFADLPYGTTNCKWDSLIDLPQLWNQYKRIIKPNGAILLFAQTPFDKVLGCSNLPWLRYEWIWEKPSATGHFNVSQMPLKAHENILVFYKNVPTYNAQKTQGHKPANKFTKTIEIQNKTEVYNRAKSNVSGGGNTDRYPRSVQVFSSDKQKTKLKGTKHSTQKPLALCEYFIETYSNENELVLDNVMGSGTTGVACIEKKRNFIGMEKFKDIFDDAKNRIKNTIEENQNKNNFKLTINE